MDEEGIDPALEPDQFETAALECPLLNFAAGKISRRLSVQQAAIFQMELGLGRLIKTHEVVGLAIDGNIIAVAGRPAALGFRLVVAGEQSFRAKRIGNS